MSTIGLVARNVNGVVKIFDVKTNDEVTDIAAHQRAREESIRIKKNKKTPNTGPGAGPAGGRDDEDDDEDDGPPPPPVNRSSRPSEV